MKIQLWIVRSKQLFLTEFSCKAFQITYDGCRNRPLSTSVAAKKASKMFELFRSLRVFTTAAIIKTLSRTVKGQAMLLTIMAMRKLYSVAAVNSALETPLS